MVVQDHGTPTGWPLGLGNLNLRLRVTESQQPAAAEAEPYSLHAHPSSFSSFSSSNLETESTASFFQDHSVSLGRLMGIKPRDREVLYFPSTSGVEQHESTISERISFPDAAGNRVEELSRGICVPLLVSILMKMTRSRSKMSR